MMGFHCFAATHNTAPSYLLHRGWLYWKALLGEVTQTDDSMTYGCEHLLPMWALVEDIIAW